jgi:hypothetical protein
MLYKISYLARIEGVAGALMMETWSSSEIWVDFQQTVRCYVPKDRTLNMGNVCLQIP